MSQVIIYQNPNGSNVVVCTPTGEIPIEAVLEKDCPVGAIIVDDSILPKGADFEFFDAWEINGSVVTVNFSKAQAIKLNKYNSSALIVAQNRQLNTLTGIENIPDDATWLSNLISDRNAIASAITTQQLINIINPS
jgi:hypothetical protein